MIYDSKALNLHKKRFSKLTVYHKLSFRSKYNHVLWYCICDCGGYKVAKAGDLKAGRVKSCGCLRYPRGKNHPKWKGGKVKVNCTWCGKELDKKPFEIKKTTNDFCDRICFGKYMSSRFNGKNHFNYKGGKIEVSCAWCGEKKEVYPCHIQMRDNFFCSFECRGKWASFNQSGKNSWNWKGGISCEPYCETWNDKEFKKYIFERDNYKCQNPDCWGNGGKLCRHHIDYNKKNCGLTNVITVCNSCNTRANANREWHTTYYNKIMEQINA